VLVAGCALTVPGGAVEAAPETDEAPPTWRRTLHWIALAAVPSGLMLSTTTHLTTDIVAIPLLWVLPLGLYLLSFVIAFAGRRKLADSITLLAPLVILICGGLAFSNGASNPLFSVTLGLILLLAIAVALHGRLFELRPAVGHLTRFYLAMSFGGMLGGLFCAIVAPLVFDWAYEHPILILAAALMVPQYALVPWSRRARIGLGIALPLLALLLSYETDLGLLGHSQLLKMGLSIAISLLALACLGRRWPYMIALGALMLSYGGWSIIERGDARTRSYFGIYEVSDRRGTDDAIVARVLTHGTTLHGIQNMLPGTETIPTSYYARRSGVGLTLSNANALFGPHPRVGIVGLGAGTLSCYFRPGESWTIFEIDPAMVHVARTRFSFLSRCTPDARIVLGDARISLARAPADSLDILAIDAFSSDAVPMHLLTREALNTYGRALDHDGIVLFHISNRYLDLRPVIADIARRDGWAMQIMEYVPSEEERTLNATVSVWIALSRNPDTLRRLTRLSGPDAMNWETLTPTPGFSGWSDDHASILPIINWRNLWPRR
jgi:SAM-dependent methyltransferase